MSSQIRFRTLGIFWDKENSYLGCIEIVLTTVFQKLKIGKLHLVNQKKSYSWVQYILFTFAEHPHKN